MLLHGNLMCWRQFEDVIPLLENTYCVYAVSFDGFDGTGEITYTTAQEQAHKLEVYIRENCGGHLNVLFAESLGCGPAILLKSSPQVQIDHMILSGPEYLDFGILNITSGHTSGILYSTSPPVPRRRGCVRFFECLQRKYMRPK